MVRDTPSHEPKPTWQSAWSGRHSSMLVRTLSLRWQKRNSNWLQQERQTDRQYVSSQNQALSSFKWTQGHQWCHQDFVPPSLSALLSCVSASDSPGLVPVVATWPLVGPDIHPTNLAPLSHQFLQNHRLVLMGPSRGTYPSPTNRSGGRKPLLLPAGHGYWAQSERLGMGSAPKPHRLKAEEQSL